MSRYDEDGDYDGTALDRGRWERNARVALKGKRGRKALAELREALMALPEHRLIEGALCTVGAEKHRAELVAEITTQWEALDARWRPAQPWLDELDDLARLIEDNGEGVCAIGAYLWHQKVKSGMDPAEAFGSLPLVLGTEGDALHETAALGRDAGLTLTLAWELAYRNDETYEGMTPEERWERFIRWIDQELASAA